MGPQYLTLLDLVITPFYVVILIFFVKRYRDKVYRRNNPLRKYFLPGLLIKFFGATFIACIYQFYYNGGDTFNYFQDAKTLNAVFTESPGTWLSLIMRVSPESDPFIYKYSSQIYFYSDAAAFMIVRITAILGLLTFNTYMPIAILFAAICFSGIWAMYRTFVNVYPTLHKQLAIAFLFVPSVFVWGSGVFKDTVCIFGLGWMTHTSFRIFVNRDFGFKNFFLLIASFLLIGIVKVYILLAFLPSLSLWLLLTYSSKIKTPALRGLTILLVLGVLASSFFFFAQQFSEELNRYSLENLSSTLETTRNWIVYSSGEEGSAYDLGKIDPSFGGILSKFPAAVAVTIFRPFLWEVNKPIVLLSALEGFIFLILFLMVFIRNGFFKSFKMIFQSPNLAFFFVYSIIFAFAVGISTGNFGTLSRYKIPCMPFLAAMLIILIYSNKVSTTPVDETKMKKRKTAPVT